MKKILRSIVILGIVFLIAGCECPFGRYKPVELVKGKKPEPLEDYRKLDALFRKHGGKFAGPEDKTVKWKDTAMYRIFEFKNHTVAIFPFNWNENCFNLFIFSGHFEKYDDLLNDISFEEIDSNYDEYAITKKILFLKNADFDVGFEGFTLGMTRERFLYWGEKKLRDVYSKEYKDENKLNEAIKAYGKGFWKDPFDPCFPGEAANTDFYIGFVDNRAVWMNFYINSVPTLLSYRLMNYKLAVLWEGEFEIPPPETETQKETVPRK